MSDFYIVAIEDEDGIFFEDPEFFDSLEEAKKESKPLSKDMLKCGYARVVYKTDYLTVLDEPALD